jgi:hypothetical protein
MVQQSQSPKFEVSVEPFHNGPLGAKFLLIVKRDGQVVERHGVESQDAGERRGAERIPCSS